jgi:hypothetical protein
MERNAGMLHLCCTILEDNADIAENADNEAVPHHIKNTVFT